MATIDELRRGRAASRSWLRRAVTKIEKIIDADFEAEELQNAIAELDKRLQSVDSFQSKIELLIDDGAVEADVNAAAEIREVAMDARWKAVRELKKASADSSNEEASSNTSSGTVRSACNQSIGSSQIQTTARLPKLELPKFGGLILDWAPFWDQFQAGVDASDLPEVTKLVYLKSLLFDEAKMAIEGLPVVSASYQVACEILKERFARPSQMIFAHVEKLLKLGAERETSLKSMQDSLLLHIRSLERLGVEGERYGILLTPLVLSRLPQSFRLEWARGSAGREGDLGYLLDCLKNEIDRHDRSKTIDGSNDIHLRDVRARASGRELKKDKPRPSVTALHSASDQGTNRGSGPGPASSSPPGKCGFCDERHTTAKCPSLEGTSVLDRHDKIKAAGLCFACLKGGHRARSCRARCVECKGKHHVVCCFKRYGKPTDVAKGASYESEPVSNDVSQSEEATLSCALTKQCTVLPTARVWIKGDKGPVQATLLFDSGSDRSYVTSSLVKRIGAKWLGDQESSYVAFGGGKSGTCRRSLYQMTVSGVNQSKPSAEIVSALEVPVICAPLQRPRVPSADLEFFRDLELADRHDPDRVLAIDLLVGLDALWQFMKDGIVRCPSGLVAQETSFGWVVSGAVSTTERRSAACQLLLMNDMPESALRNLWDLEVIGVKGDQDDEHGTLLDDFASKVAYKDGRYEVSLPWKRDINPDQLHDNRLGAENRLSRLTRKLAKDESLARSYNDALGDMEAKGIIEEVPAEERESPNPTYYMPHLPVIRPDSESTKVRPVFDASARGPNGVSLNDCLEAGPSLIPSLTDVLLRFRRHKYAVSGDISKAFLQVSVQPGDRDCLRFLWDVNGRKRVMRFCRVPFGVTSSPFLLNATIQHHLGLCPKTRTVTELQDNLYVDDWLTGADSEAEAKEMFLDGSAILSHAGMTLTKCHSNSELVLDCASASPETERLKILGVRWDPSEDVLKYDGVSVPSDIVPTKRVVLSFIARLFDPLGYLIPFVMVAKVLFQQMWLKGLEWDDPLPSEEARNFLKWIAGIPQLQQLKIPRCYMQHGVCWSQAPNLEVHVFGDASQMGYGCVSYLRYPLPSGDFDVSFVMARARVAPVKPITLPRLELLACLLAARMMDHIRKALKLTPGVRVRCWTDSTIALAWIQSEPSKWKQFVRNRVVEIQALTEPSVWSHTRGVDNPADAASRGLFAEQLIGSEMWSRGPKWLRCPLEQPSCEMFVTSEDVADGRQPPSVSESRTGQRDSPAIFNESPNEATLLSHPASTPVCVFPLERWSSLTKAIRVAAWVRRFTHNARHPECRIATADLSCREISDAKMTLISQTQRSLYPAEHAALTRCQPVSKSSPISKLSPFMSSDGLIRMRGRLQMSDLSTDEKHPIILPNCHLSVLIVRFQHRLMCHAGVGTMLTALRSSYWIVSARRIAKSVKRECVSCQRHDAQPCCEPAGPLPRLRVSDSGPFAVTGVDFAGPLFSVDQPRRKLYICLFTCATTRAVHLELTESLSLSSFLLALRRFAARRGWPRVIYSDNAKTFKACSAHLRSSMTHTAPEWRFTVPYAPWYGGWWERLIRSVKVGLRKSLGQRCLPRDELETALHEVEACVNSRPLTFVSDDSGCSNALTPNHFLLGRSSVFGPEVSGGVENASAESLGRLKTAMSERLERFWRVWRDDYVRNLPAVVPKFGVRGDVRLDSVVIIRRDNVPRMKWPMATVVKLNRGKDGVTRSVDVRTSDGRRTRCAVQRLHNLELV